jgi:hypothetical protein
VFLTKYYDCKLFRSSRCQLSSNVRVLPSVSEGNCKNTRDDASCRTVSKISSCFFFFFWKGIFSTLLARSRHWIKILLFFIIRRVRKLAKSDYQPSHTCLSVRPSVRTSIRLFVRMEQLCSHWTDFDEICYLSFFRKSVKKIKFSLKSDKNNGYFTCRRFHICDNISLNYSYKYKRLK